MAGTDVLMVRRPATAIAEAVWTVGGQEPVWIFVFEA